MIAFVLCKESTKGPPMSIAYEDIKLMPKEQRTRSLMINEARDDKDAE